MVKCELCGKELKDNRGVRGHVIFDHKIPWEDYQKQYMNKEEQNQKPPEAKEESPSNKQEPQEQKPLETEAEKEKPNEQKQELPAKKEEFDEQELAKKITQTVMEQLKSLLSPSSSTTKTNEGLPEGVYPIGEEVEVEGEKVNYKVALDPEIFYLYNVFKAEAERRGRKWDGSFGDFLYMAVKDMLTVHGLYPAIVSLKSGNLLVKLKEG